MNPLFRTGFSISDSLKSVRKTVLIYETIIVPGTKSPAQLSRSFIHNPFQGAKYAYYVEIDVTDLDVVYGRDNVFVILNQEPLDLMDRIVSYGKVGD